MRIGWMEKETRGSKVRREVKEEGQVRSSARRAFI